MSKQPARPVELHGTAWNGLALRTLLHVAEMTPGQLAVLCGVSPRAVQLWLKDQRPMPVLVRRVMRGIALGVVSRRALEGLAVFAAVLVLSASDADARSRRAGSWPAYVVPSYVPPPVRSAPVRRAAPVYRGPSPLWVVPLMGGGSGDFCWSWDQRQRWWMTCY